MVNLISKVRQKLGKIAFSGKLHWMFFLLDTTRQFGEAVSVPFLVANDTVDLGKIILGTNFCKQVNIKLNFEDNKSNATAYLRNRVNKHQIMNLMMKSDTCHLTQTENKQFQANEFLCENYVGSLTSEDKTENLGKIQFDVVQTTIWNNKRPQLKHKCPIMEIGHLDTNHKNIYFHTSSNTNENIAATKVRIQCQPEQAGTN